MSLSDHKAAWFRLNFLANRLTMGPWHCPNHPKSILAARFAALDPSIEAARDQGHLSPRMEARSWEDS